jgi:HEAT repeat protein
LKEEYVIEHWTDQLEQKLDLAWELRVLTPEIIESAPSAGQRAATYLADMDDPVLRPQTTRQNEDRYVRSASTSRGQLGDPRAVESLIADLVAFDPNLRWRAAMMLGELRDPRSVKPLAVALYDASMRVAQMAASALGKLGDARAVEPLVAALHDGTEWRRECAAEALRSLGKLAVPALIAASKDKSRLVRKQARQLLKDIGTPTALEVLDQHQTDIKSSPSKLLDLTRSLIGKHLTVEQPSSEVQPLPPWLEDNYRQDDIARGLRASLVAVLATALAGGSADRSYLQGVFSLAQSQAALYGIPWVDVVSSLCELSHLPVVARLQNSADTCLKSGKEADKVIEGEHHTLP